MLPTLNTSPLTLDAAAVTNASTTSVTNVKSRVWRPVADDRQRLAVQLLGQKHAEHRAVGA